MELSTYVSWLIDSNRAITGEPDLRKFAVTYGFGLIEEYGEFIAEVGSEEARAKEAGDVLAYTVLLLHTFDDTNDSIVKTISNGVTQKPAIGANVASYLKRFYRGDELDVSDDLAFTKLLREHLTWVINQTGLSVETIAIINKHKLEKRLSNTGTFKGKGDR